MFTIIPSVGAQASKSQLLLVGGAETATNNQDPKNDANHHDADEIDAGVNNNQSQDAADQLSHGSFFCIIPFVLLRCRCVLYPPELVQVLSS